MSWRMAVRTQQFRGVRRERSSGDDAQVGDGALTRPVCPWPRCLWSMIISLIADEIVQGPTPLWRCMRRISVSISSTRSPIWPLPHGEVRAVVVFLHEGGAGHQEDGKGSSSGRREHDAGADRPAYRFRMFAPGPEEHVDRPPLPCSSSARSPRNGNGQPVFSISSGS